MKVSTSCHDDLNRIAFNFHKRTKSGPADLDTSIVGHDDDDCNLATLCAEVQHDVATLLAQMSSRTSADDVNEDPHEAETHKPLTEYLTTTSEPQPLSQINPFSRSLAYDTVFSICSPIESLQQIWTRAPPHGRHTTPLVLTTQPEEVAEPQAPYKVALFEKPYSPASDASSCRDSSSPGTSTPSQSPNDHSLPVNVASSSKASVFKGEKSQPAVHISNSVVPAKTAIMVSSPSVGRPSPPLGALKEECECHISHGAGYICNQCHDGFCDGCWEQERVHRKKELRSDEIPHEKTEYDLYFKVRDCLSPAMNPAQMEAAHEKDMKTAWFGVVDEDPYPVFRDYGKLADIISAVKDTSMSSTNATVPSLNDTLCPSLTSFVGQTGAGKSTLIKLLIQLNPDDVGDLLTPVVGSRTSNNPTSEDVHLYLAPEITETRVGLFADCEGLDGGEREPIGARVRRKVKRRLMEGQGRKRFQSERDLIWATEPGRRKREFIVSQLYPRILYTFSDVIVFVHRNRRMIENVFETLLEWAMNAIETSVGQPILPHAIIVFNAADYDSSESYWDPESSTVEFMESLTTCVERLNFQKYVDFWKDRGTSITTFEQLLHSYYRSITVMNIPKGDSPTLLNTQIQRLQKLISSKSEEAQQEKLKDRWLMGSGEFSAHLASAFDHFARSLDNPFDFVKSSFAHNPIPNNVAGNIVKLARQVQARWPNTSGFELFEELGTIVSSCIMLDAARNNIRGDTGAVFKEYSSHVEEALAYFCEQYWPCEFQLGDKRCVNVRAVHGSKGHQAATGKIIAPGEWHSQFTHECYFERFCNMIYYNLQWLRRCVLQQQRLETTEAEAAALVHKTRILRNFYKHVTKGRRALVSHSICLSCLFEPPEHALPCGHIICTTCLQQYSRNTNGGGSYTITECPVEDAQVFEPPARFLVKPPQCGVRILTLDGGGVNGIVELETLRCLEQKLGQTLHIRHFFDLVVGTSAGGLIALGLTVYNWSIDECIEKFKQFSQQAFSNRKGVNNKLTGWVVEPLLHHKCRTKPLEDGLKSCFGTQDRLFGGRKTRTITADSKVAIVATSTLGRTTVFSNYNRREQENLSYHFYRPEDASFEFRAHQVARATFAAPKYFKPYLFVPTKEEFIDGSVHHSNPVKIADSEARLIWPTTRQQQPDLVLSLGSSQYPQRSDSSTENDQTENSSKRYLMRVAQDRLQNPRLAEAIWSAYIADKSLDERHRRRYIRLNPRLHKPVKLHDITAIDRLQKTTKDDISSSPLLMPLAYRMMASCFYFVSEPASTRPDDNFEATGAIQCRFANRSSDEPDNVKAVAEFIAQNSRCDHEFRPHFKVRLLQDQAIVVNEVELDLENMMRHSAFHGRKIDVVSRGSITVTDIVLCYRPGEEYSISGFPRRIHEERNLRSERRQTDSVLKRNRWGVRNSRRRPKWQTPAVREAGAPRRIEKYSDDDYWFGNRADHETLTWFPDVASAAELDGTPVEEIPEVEGNELHHCDAINNIPSELSPQQSLNARSQFSFEINELSPQLERNLERRAEKRADGDVLVPDAQDSASLHTLPRYSAVPSLRKQKLPSTPFYAVATRCWYDLERDTGGLNLMTGDFVLVYKVVEGVEGEDLADTWYVRNARNGLHGWASSKALQALKSAPASLQAVSTTTRLPGYSELE